MLRYSGTWPLLGLLVMSAVETEASAVPFSAINDTTALVTSSGVASSITSSARLPPWGTSPVPLNTCSYTTVNGTATTTLWNEPYCSLTAGTVQLHFYPTKDGKTYPHTSYDSLLDYTFTSPSVYMIINTLSAWNECGPLGPAPTSAIFAFDLDQVSTLVPYPDTTATYLSHSTRQLYLSDLDTGCSTSFNISAIQTQTRYTKDINHRCNPNIAIPIQIKRYGYPYWAHCGNKGIKFGLFDPPYAMSPIGDDPTTTTTSAEPTVPQSTTATPTPATSSQSVNSPPASPASSSPQEIPTATTTAGNDVPSTSAVSAHDDTPQSTQTTGGGDGEKSPPPTQTTGSGDNETPPSIQTTGSGDSEKAPSSTQTTGGGDSGEAPPPPGTSVASASITTVSRQIVSLGSSGVVVINEYGSGSATTTTYGVPVYGTTDSGSSLTQASVVVYQSQTLTLGGPPATVTSAVVVLPKNSTSATSSGIARVATATASRVMTGGMIALFLGALATLCLM